MVSRNEGKRNRKRGETNTTPVPYSAMTHKENTNFNGKVWHGFVYFSTLFSAMVTWYTFHYFGALLPLKLVEQL